MKSLRCLVTITALFLTNVESTKNKTEQDNTVWNIVGKQYSTTVQNSPSGDAGDKLILTPLIEKGSFEKARRQSEVKSDRFPPDTPSYAAFITTEKKYNSNLFFWYFPAKETISEDTPLLVWLQGGPGVSSMMGLFKELGPFTVNENQDVIVNNYSWNKNYNLLFIDNPVGTGFSFTNDSMGYETNQASIGQHLYVFILQFFQVFPEVLKVPLYITGESYAGKYVPAFAYEIHNNNQNAKTKLNLKGISIGNGYTDPYTLLKYSLYGNQLSLIDDRATKQISDAEDKCKKIITDEDYDKAYTECQVPLNLLMDYSQLSDIYNYESEKPSELGGPYVEFLNNVEIRKAIHVGNSKFEPLCKEVGVHLKDDFFRSAKPFLEKLLGTYKVLVYSGQLDVIVGYPLSVRTYRSLKWSGSYDYLNADRKPWHLRDVVIGYSKKADNFLEVLVRNAGHMVPMDQPERALLLITSFVNDSPLD